MAIRSSVSAVQNVWYDSEQVDDTDLSLEQEYNNTKFNSIIENHVGSGVIPEFLLVNTLFDSSKTTGLLDGILILPQAQPSDTTLGNQLQLSLTESAVFGNRRVKIAVVGLDFNSELQYESFTFSINEIQTGKKHFTKILGLLFNDFVGQSNQSFNLGGNLVISEAPHLSISRDPIMISQDVQPNLFFRDFYTTSGSLANFLKQSFPLYNTDSLNIQLAPLDTITLPLNDVTIQVGQKFKATTNNIQKITLLLSVANFVSGQTNDLVWNGDLVFSVSALQTDVACPTDIAPDLDINFPPQNTPLSQISINYNSLLAQGIVLDAVPQPVDFVLSNTSVASGSIVPGNYYAFTLKRAGSADKCTISLALGTNVDPTNTVETIYTGSVWSDITEQSLWFQVWTDAIKLVDGQAYESGHGVEVPKTFVDPSDSQTKDYSQGGIQFIGNETYSANLVSTTVQSYPVQDQTTGNTINSRQEYVPSISLLNAIGLAALTDNSNPLLLGSVVDSNIKFNNAMTATTNFNLSHYGMVGNTLFVKVITDTVDPKYDASIALLQSKIVTGEILGSKAFINGNNTSKFFRVARAEICDVMCGDLDGDGIVTPNDLNLLNQIGGYDLTVAPTAISTLTTTTVSGNSFIAYSNGYTTQTQPFVTAFGISFSLLDGYSNQVVATGTDAAITPSAIDPSMATLSSASVDFSAFPLATKLVITTTAQEANHGGFMVAFRTSAHVINIQKLLLTDQLMMQVLAGDIDGNFKLDSNDNYLLNTYLTKAAYPGVSFSSYSSIDPYYKIGTTFKVIKIEIEQFVDRRDDYCLTISTRNNVLHTVQDIFGSDSVFAAHNYSTPIASYIEKQFLWNAWLIKTSSHPREVPAVFVSNTEVADSLCVHPVEVVGCSQYPVSPAFVPGAVDYYIPNNLIIGSGDLIRPDGSFYKVDMEIGTIVLEIPDASISQDKSINIFADLVAHYGNGQTRIGYPAMKFSDCSYVGSDALAKNQLKFDVAVQSFSPNINGDVGSNEAIIVDPKIGVYMDYSSGILTLNFTNLFEDVTLKTAKTKIQITVYIKKAGFNNTPLVLSSTIVGNLLQ